MHPTIDTCDACGRTDELRAIADLMVCETCQRVTCRACGRQAGAWWPDLGVYVCTNCGRSWEGMAGE